MASRELFVNSIDILPIAGQASIPTALCYSAGSSKLIGTAAIDRGVYGEHVNENFKIELGRVKLGGSPDNRARFETGDGTRKSAFEITSDFFSVLGDHVSSALQKQGLSRAGSVLISEPLSFYAQEDDDWLQNYRGNVTRILQSKFDTIEYLPEPFAVFQYYRYGARHKTVASDKKYFALVVDFGGGTFDVSIVETTNTGDISMSGRHSRPLGAHSNPFGGYEINKLIAKYLVLRQFNDHPDRNAIQKSIGHYTRWQKGEIALEDLNPRNQSFVRAYHALVREAERKKIVLSRSVLDWSLDGPARQSVNVEFAEDPSHSSSRLIPLRFSAEELRDIFVKEIWPRYLRPSVKGALERASADLKGRSIQVALMSGGSANLRWLEALLKQDFANELSSASVVTLAESYQEVVAKGLALECARRAYEPRSEFSDVTYNPVYLVLDPDGRGEERRVFRRVDPDSKNAPQLAAAQLLESATALEGDAVRSLEWKVRLDHPPKRFLDYYFLRDPSRTDALENRYNIVKTRAHTSRGVHIKGPIRVRLDIRPDGTSIPTFVYLSDMHGNPIHSVPGEPFWLDMVPAVQGHHRPAYLGIDFGTSTSAVSYVDWQQVRIQEERGRDAGWLQLNELTDFAFPLAAPLKAYLASREYDMASRAVEALEAALGFLAVALWAEITSADRAAKVRVFGKGWKRSAGPLNKALFDLLEMAGTKGEIARSLKKALPASTRTEISEVVNRLDRIKHHKEAPGALDCGRVMEILGNSATAALRTYRFGYFRDVRKVGFRDNHSGVFVIANGTPPFYERLTYSGRYSFSQDEAFLVNPEAGFAISLAPLMFWRIAEHRPDIADACYVFDGLSREGAFEFKQVAAPSTISLGDSDPHSLIEVLDKLPTGEVVAQKFDGLRFQSNEQS